MGAGEVLTACGLTAVALSGRNRVAAAAGGAALTAAFALTRFGVFYAGRASARDPGNTIRPRSETGSGSNTGLISRATG